MRDGAISLPPGGPHASRRNGGPRHAAAGGGPLNGIDRVSAVLPLRSLPPDATTAIDYELVRRASTGDQVAFETIMRRHNRALYRVARSILGNDADAEEAVQEGYLSAYRALSAFRAEARLRTWLTRIVMNHAFERLRKRKRRARAAGSDNPIALEPHLDPTLMKASTQATPERIAMRAQARMLLERHIDTLPTVFRVVFVMRAVEELSVEETAACLRIPAATVRTRYFRARQLLRRAITTDAKAALLDAFAFDGARCDRLVQEVLRRIA